MSLCPCGSGRELNECCGPILDGAPALTAEALMRSRYTAFVVGNIEHVDRTHAAEIRDDFNRAEAERAAEEIEWLGLDIRRVSEEVDTGTVEFMVRMRRDGQELAQYEVSSFRRIDGNWFYTGGKTSPNVPPRRVLKIARNDPCPCGSGKKYKKCCGT
jgi:SEC-C motif domain protein